MFSPEGGIRLRGSARTHKGRVRQNNEDNVHLLTEGHSMLAIVADGMGGAAAGEEASRIAIDTIHAGVMNGTYRSLTDFCAMNAQQLIPEIERLVHLANDNIVQRAIDAPEMRGMGTTLIVAVIRDVNVLLAHVGDSRAYLYSGDDGRISQITSDHSFVQALVDAGHITPADAEEHPMRNVLYRALGPSHELDVDIIEDVYLRPGDRLIMCTDGLTLHVDAGEIADIVRQHGDDPHQMTEAMIALANQRGGRDNISVIVITADENDATLSAESHYELRSYEDDDPTLPLNTVRGRPSTKRYQYPANSASGSGS